jgi:hypothetical protein
VPSVSVLPKQNFYANFPLIPLYHSLTLIKSAYSNLALHFFPIITRNSAEHLSRKRKIIRGLAVYLILLSASSDKESWPKPMPTCSAQQQSETQVGIDPYFGRPR